MNEAHSLINAEVVEFDQRDTTSGWRSHAEVHSNSVNARVMADKDCIVHYMTVEQNPGL